MTATVDQPLALRARLPESLTKDSVEEVAWMAWTTLTEQAVRANIEPTPALELGWGVPGYRIARSMRSVLVGLYPAAQALSDADWSVWSGPIYAYLRASTNAVCLDRDASPPVWWVRKAWRDAVGVPVYRHLPPTAREARLTPGEAGEDRMPGEVSVRWRCPVPGCGAEFDSPEAFGGHAATAHVEDEPCPVPGCGRRIKGAGPLKLHLAWHREQDQRAADAEARAATLDGAFARMRDDLGRVVAVAVDEATAGLREELAVAVAERDRLAEQLAALRRVLDGG